MRTSRWFGWGLVGLGAVVATTALLGPWALDVIHYRTSPTTLNQVVGGDAAAFLVVAPVTVLVGVLALRRHPAAPVLALAPALFVTYTYTQLIVGEEYLRLPGNNERFFPLLLAGFVLAGAIAITAWRSAAPEKLPPMSRRLARVMAVVLGLVAAFVVFGLHLSSLVDAVRDHPLRTEYVSSPTPFWLVKLMDLGIVVPVAAATAVGLWRGAAWAAKPAYAVIGGYTLLAASVAGMAVTMYANSDPDSSLATVAAFVTFTLAFAVLSVTLYRPLFGRSLSDPSADRVSRTGDNDAREPSGAARRPPR